MPDRNKVMRGLQQCIDGECGPSCPYSKECGEPGAPRVMGDALALLVDPPVALTIIKDREPQWIPVTERLPENDSGVLAFYDDGIESRIIPATFHPKSGWYDCLFNMPSENISYWMPLPEPPKEDENEGC